MGNDQSLPAMAKEVEVEEVQKLKKELKKRKKRKKKKWQIYWKRARGRGRKFNI